MNLNELVLRSRMPPKKGSYEIVRSPDGINHLMVITEARDVPENGCTVREFSFSLWCCIPNLPPGDYEVAKRNESLTCIKCIQWRSTCP